MQKDPVLEEIWLIKDEQAARFGYDVRKLAQALSRLGALRPSRRSLEPRA